MPSVARDLRNSLETCLLSVAGPEYNKLKYLDDINKNSFGQGHGERYGVRPGITPEFDGVTKHLTYTQTFQFVLTKGFCNDGVSDTDQYEAFLDLHEIALTFNNKVINTKAGLPSRVLNVVNLSLADPVFLEDKVAVLTGNIDIIYRLTL